MDLGVVLWKEEHSPTEDELRQRMEDDGFEVMAWTDPPGATYEPHSNGQNEVISPFSGSIEFTIDGRSYLLNPGDTLFLPKDTVHTARVPPTKKVSYLIGQLRGLY